MLYRSKPTEIEAVQWTGDNFTEVEAAVGDKVRPPLDTTNMAPDEVEAIDNAEDLLLNAGKDGAQKWVPVPAGHWIVHQPDDLSDVWPVEDAYFKAKYEPAVGPFDDLNVAEGYPPEG